MTRLALVVAAACTLAAPAAWATARPVITERDSGKQLTARVGSKLTLRLSSRYRWTLPRLRGTAVALVPVDYVRDPGFREWTIAARVRGTARITALGHGESQGRTCDPGPCAPRLFRVTLVVR